VIVALMGVSGAGKTVVGRQLAQRLGWTFLDADDFHSAANIAKMRRGIALDDDDRLPWLRAIRAAVDEAAGHGLNVVVACSALREAYRRVLFEGLADVHLIYLDAPREVLRRRLESRHDHFMPANLLDSQLATLEPPDKAVVIDATQPVDDIVETLVRRVSQT
jgi:gluconokinase